MSYVLLPFCTKLGLQLISISRKPILGIDTQQKTSRSKPTIVGLERYHIQGK